MTKTLENFQLKEIKNLHMIIGGTMALLEDEDDTGGNGSDRPKGTGGPGSGSGGQG